MLGLATDFVNGLGMKQDSQKTSLQKTGSAHYLYVIIGMPIIAIFIAMAPALQARFPWFTISTTIRGISGLLLQAVPFTLIGVLVSAAVETFVTAQFVEKHMPKSTSDGFLVAIAAGFCMPVCDCVIVPTFSRLIAKKLPLPAAVTFLCAVPVVNPVSVLATWYAFSDAPAVVVIRIALGIVIALLTGISFVIFPQKSQILKQNFISRQHLEDASGVSCCCKNACSHNEDTCDSKDACDIENNCNSENACVDCKDTCENCPESSKHLSFGLKLLDYFHHVYEDFVHLMPIILFGTIVASVIRAWLGNDPASRLNTTFVLISIPMMMLIAYASSLCSSSDAVIARSLAASLPISSVIAFLIFGPMLDIKNTLMLISDCKAKFVLRITLTITVLCLLGSLLIHFAWGGAI